MPYSREADLLNEDGTEFLLLFKKHSEKVPGSKLFAYGYVTTGISDKIPIDLVNLVDKNNLRYIPSKTTKTNNYHNIYDVTRLDLNDIQETKNYIFHCLKHLRQIPCKVLAKIWIKAIEPKKKIKYPYINGDAAKPNWWPVDVQHKEPDHLQKPERLQLMYHILVQVLPEKYSIEFIKDLEKSSTVIPAFKNDPQKYNILQTLFDISIEIKTKEKSELTVILWNHHKRKDKSSTPVNEPRLDNRHSTIYSSEGSISECSNNQITATPNFQNLNETFSRIIETDPKMPFDFLLGDEFYIPGLNEEIESSSSSGTHSRSSIQ
ncbi:hypothetical protein C6P45_001239 [Maudiozyma exigua]|uniref:Subtelomeric hrmA-associated cluster protein AFUB-079030/YDR124W-like helical bundle domain-containing protein n=1 Tax=Maudiozyma exigua TaxID=34358 RepID=A0A9P7B678_MAUEX|nr:hypothetical protein C6P45_001239 [Kazachstania exigua]